MFINKFVLLVIFYMPVFYGHSQLSTKRRIYNNKGQLVIIKRLDWNGKVTKDCYGIATIKFSYNNYNKIDKIEHYGLDGTLIKTKDSSDFIYAEKVPSIVKFTYDENGHIKRKSFLDHKEKPLGISYRYDPVSYIEYKTDSKGRIIESRFFNSKGQAMSIGLSYSYENYIYDNNGLIIKMINDAGGEKQIHHYEYNNRNELIPKGYKYLEVKNDSIQMISLASKEHNFSFDRGVKLSLNGWKLPSIEIPKIKLQNIKYRDFEFEILVTEDGKIKDILNEKYDCVNKDALFICYDLLDKIKFSPIPNQKLSKKGKIKIMFGYNFEDEIVSEFYRINIK